MIYIKLLAFKLKRHTHHAFLSMEKAYDKHDLTKFFNNIKGKHVIPRPDTNIPGKVICRNGYEFIEKPFNKDGC